jgi:hypothetical protein
LVDAISDEAANFVQKMSFDAWGKRREVIWQVMAGSLDLCWSQLLQRQISIPLS